MWQISNHSTFVLRLSERKHDEKFTAMCVFSHISLDKGIKVDRALSESVLIFHKGLH